jgi:hypothetical protein
VITLLIRRALGHKTLGAIDYFRSLLNHRILCHLGDSRPFLKKILTDAPLRGKNIFFYLDAHGGEDPPLQEEAGVIVSPLQPGSGWPWNEAGPRTPDFMPDGCAWPAISIVTPSYNQGKFMWNC